MRSQDVESSSVGTQSFAATQWSMVLRAQERNTALAQDALEQLCQLYWYPLYGFVRRGGYDVPTAEDLTQDFFVRITQKDFLHSVDRSKGKFRSFLLASLKNFLANERARSRAAKRGGGRLNFSLDAEMAENRFKAEPFHEATPEKAFDRAWAVALLDNALASLKQEYVERGSAELFDAVLPYLSGDRDQSSYALVAARLNTTEAAIKMAVVRLRRRYGQMLRSKVGQTVASEAELNEELRHLFTALAN
jgi:DNA-directed RNA polymerase specialized sigma24 family protein